MKEFKVEAFSKPVKSLDDVKGELVLLAYVRTGCLYRPARDISDVNELYEAQSRNDTKPFSRILKRELGLWRDAVRELQDGLIANIEPSDEKELREFAYSPKFLQYMQFLDEASVDEDLYFRKDDLIREHSLMIPELARGISKSDTYADPEFWKRGTLINKGVEIL